MTSSRNTVLKILETTRPVTIEVSGISDKGEANKLYRPWSRLGNCAIEMWLHPPLGPDAASIHDGEFESCSAIQSLSGKYFASTLLTDIRLSR